MCVRISALIEFEDISAEVRIDYLCELGGNYGILYSRKICYGI